jgi:hypothetical protein
MNVEAKLLDRSFANVGSAKNGNKNLTKINRGSREKEAGCVVYSFIISLQSSGSSSV